MSISNLSFNRQGIGKIVKSLITVFNWNFDIENKRHTITLTIEIFPYSLTILFDTDHIAHEKLKLDTNYKYKFSRYNHDFELKLNNQRLELLIDGVDFFHMLNLCNENKLFRNNNCDPYLIFINFLLKIGNRFVEKSKQSFVWESSDGQEVSKNREFDQEINDSNSMNLKLNKNEKVILNIPILRKQSSQSQNTRSSISKQFGCPNDQQEGLSFPMPIHEQQRPRKKSNENDFIQLFGRKPSSKESSEKPNTEEGNPFDQFTQFAPNEQSASQQTESSSNILFSEWVQSSPTNKNENNDEELFKNDATTATTSPQVQGNGVNTNTFNFFGEFQSEAIPVSTPTPVIEQQKQQTFPELMDLYNQSDREKQKQIQAYQQQQWQQRSQMEMIWLQERGFNQNSMGFTSQQMNPQISTHQNIVNPQNNFDWFNFNN